MRISQMTIYVALPFVEFHFMNVDEHQTINAVSKVGVDTKIQKLHTTGLA